jgi:hypothetical protein
MKVPQLISTTNRGKSSYVERILVDHVAEGKPRYSLIGAAAVYLRELSRMRLTPTP